MGKPTVFCLILTFITYCPSLAQSQAAGTSNQNRTLEDSETVSESKIVPRPLRLSPDQVLSASNSLQSPVPPEMETDGKPSRPSEDILAPDTDTMDSFSNAAVFPQIERLERDENQPQKFYWHSFTIGSYCHYYDLEGNHWYGWDSGEKFHWVLQESGHFWWHDTTLNRWLYFAEENWWWPQNPDASRLQVYSQGDYYPYEATSNSTEASFGSIQNGTGLFRRDFLPEDSNPHPRPHSKRKQGTGRHTLENDGESFEETSEESQYPLEDSGDAEVQEGGTSQPSFGILLHSGGDTSYNSNGNEAFSSGGNSGSGFTIVRQTTFILPAASLGAVPGPGSKLAPAPAAALIVTTKAASTFH